MAADHSARGSMKTGVKPETVCELQDTNDHRQVERKWRLPISVGELSALEGRFIVRAHILCVLVMDVSSCSALWSLLASRTTGVVSSDAVSKAACRTPQLRQCPGSFTYTPLCVCFALFHRYI